ncbi:MAG: Gfo/Idh/MocA family oxidoreductase [Candidatus Krumholzibacteriia bacterium]
MTLHVGLIGAGTHGERYLRHLRDDVDGMIPVALCRRDPEAGSRLAGELGVRHHAEASALISNPGVDAVIVTTPPSSHFLLAKRVLEAGKALLLEKPMTATLREARRLVAMESTTSAPPLMLAQTLRWNPVVQRVRELWPRLGKVHLIRLAQRLEPTDLAWQRERTETVGGSVLLTGVHLFDLARYLSGQEFVRVASTQRRVLNPAVEDLFLARAEVEDGTWISLEVSKYTRSRAGWLEVVGEQAQIHADYLDGRVELLVGRERERFDADASAPTLPHVLAAWRDALATGTRPPVTATDGLRTLEVTEACYRSSHAGGQPVRIADLD